MEKRSAHLGLVRQWYEVGEQEGEYFDEDVITIVLEDDMEVDALALFSENIYLILFSFTGVAIVFFVGA